LVTCSTVVYEGYCCTCGGCRTDEGNCQSDTWYVSPSTNKTIICAPNACDNPCTINAGTYPKTYVTNFIENNEC
jgi:hypothetical protein